MVITDPEIVQRLKYLVFAIELVQTIIFKYHYSRNSIPIHIPVELPTATPTHIKFRYASKVKAIRALNAAIASYR